MYGHSAILLYASGRYSDIRPYFCTRVADIRTFGHTFIREWPLYGHSDVILFMSGRYSDIRPYFCTRVADVRTFRRNFVHEWPMYGHSSSPQTLTQYKKTCDPLRSHVLSIFFSTISNYSVSLISLHPYLRILRSIM